MPMRQDCKHFESRTYRNGETVRKCNLDLAPEAPWRCPEDCPSYTRRMADVNWSHGALVTPETPAEPASLGQDDSIAELLDAAEDIVNSVAESTLAEVQAEKRKMSKRGGLGPGRSGKGMRRSGRRSSRGEGLGERLRRRYRDGR